MNAPALKLRRGLLQALAAIPPGYLLPEDTLRADAARVVIPRPTTAALDQELAALDSQRLIIGVDTEEGRKWRIADAGRAWLAEHG